MKLILFLFSIMQAFAASDLSLEKMLLEKTQALVQDDPIIRNSIVNRTKNYLDQEKQRTIDHLWRAGKEGVEEIQFTLFNGCSLRLRDFIQKFRPLAAITITDTNGAIICTSSKVEKYSFKHDTCWKATYQDGNSRTYKSKHKWNGTLSKYIEKIGFPIRYDDQLKGIVMMYIDLDEMERNK